MQVSNTQLKKRWLIIFSNLLSKLSKFGIKKAPTLFNFHVLTLLQNAS
jgi:hypothetical protein